MCLNKKQGEIALRTLGRWSEGIGLGILAGIMITYSINNVLYWFWLFGGLIFLGFGAYIHESVKT